MTTSATVHDIQGDEVLRAREDLAADVAAGIRAESTGRAANYDRHFAALKRILDRDGANDRN